ncbi:histidine kinase internal region [Pseudomonas syringae pv. persicae]|uniref:Histidine kinase internal region n=1 Tax=Pseudomonas syringae pv. persicae TaxID=237306 RepID=A0AB38E9N3_9PSED|nr:histidine kinase internal region [Pseudomonas syringae pv. persicae]SOQ05042.1 histidine kinase internal region [Pseudomonas syringae pv. persicae]
MRIEPVKTPARPAPGKDFFLPELCLPQALLVLVVLAELLVVILVLVEPMRAGFDWR